MKRKILNINFLTAVSKIIPNKTKLVNFLANILHIEKEAVYRRLRGEVPFTFAEVATISEHLHISVDQILGLPPSDNGAFSLNIHDYENPSEESLVSIKNYVSIMDLVKLDFNSEVLEAWNTLPFPICFQFDYLNRFYVFKQKYYCNKENKLKKFKETSLFYKIKEYQTEHMEAYKTINKSTFIFDSMIIPNVIKEINYFRALNLLNENDIIYFKKDLLNYIDYLELLAKEGCYPTTGKQVDIYIAGINIDTNYSALSANNYTLCLIGFYNYISSSEKVIYDYIYSWLEGFKRFSIRLNEDSHNFQSNFFNDQRKIIFQL